MKGKSLGMLLALLSATFVGTHCTEGKSNDIAVVKDSTTAVLTNNNGYASQVQWGAHLVSISGCNDCHTPKKMGPKGPENNMDLELSGHPSQSPEPKVDRQEIESKGLGVTGGLTEWIGPWGISYAANITSDSTGIGGWKEDQFIFAMRNGKWKGLPLSLIHI